MTFHASIFFLAILIIHENNADLGSRPRNELTELDDFSKLVRCTVLSESDWFVVPNLFDYPITDERQIPSGRDPATLAKNESEEQHNDIHHFSHFPFNFGTFRRYWAHGLNDSCVPELHEKWITQKKITDFFRTDEWRTKICNFPRFLHCGKESRVCECAPLEEYQVKFLNQTGDEKTPCVADTHQPCFLHIPVGKWPARIHSSFTVNLVCARGSKCLRHKNRITGKVADLCGRCVPLPPRLIPKHSTSVRPELYFPLLFITLLSLSLIG